MSTTPGAAFHYHLEESQNEMGFTVTTVKCQGKLISENTEEIRQVVQPLILRGGRIALDFTDLEYRDSARMGAIVGLKVSAISRRLCVLELVNLTPRV